MYKDLFFNLMLIISVISIIGQVFKNKSLILNVYTKILFGAFGGIFGTILMLFSIPINEVTKIDLRYLVIVLLCLFIGKTTTIIAALIIAANRIIIFGVSVSSLTNLTAIALLLICCIVISSTNMSQFKKLVVMNIMNILSFGGAISYVIKEGELALKIIGFYSLITFIGGFLAYSICIYVFQSNANYRKLKEMASTDYLTGLNNVRQFDTIWTNYVEKAKQFDDKFSLLIIDIDFFKKINDNYGHLAGDIILKEIGEILSKTTRSQDTVSRNGGEEFSVLLPNCEEKKAIETAERIRKTIQNHNFIINEKTINVTASIGVASYPSSTEKIEDLIKIADEHLYFAKDSGRNKVVFEM